MREPAEGNDGKEALPVERCPRRALAETEGERLGEEASKEDIKPEADALSDAERECGLLRAMGLGDRMFMFPPPIAPLRLSDARRARSSCVCTVESGATCTVPESCA